MRVINKACLAAAVAASVTTALPAGAQGNNPWSFSGDFSVRRDDNIGLAPSVLTDVQAQAIAQNAQIRFDDITTRIAGTVSYDVVRDSGREFVLSATPFYARVSDLDGLSNYGLSVDATYRGEFGGNFTDPWFSASAGYTLLRFDDSDVREGGIVELELILGKRFSPKFGISGGARYFDRSQENSSGLCPNRTDAQAPNCPASWQSDQVFDLSKWGVFAHGDYFFNDKTALFLEYSLWDGDEASTFSFGVSNPTPFADDPAFGTAFTTGNGTPIDYRVWKVDAKQHVVELGVAHQLTQQVLVNLTFIHLETSDLERAGANGPIAANNYRNDAIELSASFSFK